MIKSFGTLLGNTTSISTALFASINHEDARLWVVAIAGLALTLLGNKHKKYKDKIDAQKAKEELCDACIKRGRRPVSCVVRIEHRPKDCPFRKREGGRNE